MGIIEEIIVDVFGDKAPEPQTHSNATEQPEVSAAPEEDVAEIANGDEEPEPQTHTNATKQPEVSPASEGNVTEITTTQEPGAVFIEISFNDEVSFQFKKSVKIGT